MVTLKQARKAARIGQQVLSYYCEISQTELSLIETGKVKPHESTKRKIEIVLNCKIDWS